MSTLVSQLLSACDAVEQRRLIDGHPHLVDEPLLAEVKAAAASLLRCDAQRSLDLGALILHAAAASARPEHRALGLIAVANVLSLGGQGRDADAVPLYEEAAAIYRSLGRPVDEANAQIAKILALTNLGRHEEAFAAGEFAAPILEAHGEWLKLGKLKANLGNLRFRRGEPAQALILWDAARENYGKLAGDPSARAALGRTEHNRSAALRDLGRFDEAIATAGRALDILAETGQSAEVARCQQNLGICYYIMGRHNDALSLLNRAQAEFLRDGRQRDAIVVSIYTGQCLLQLGRFSDALDLSRRAADLFAACGERFYLGQARLNEATAYAGLRRPDEAMAALAEARGYFEAENPMWVALTDLEGAAVLARLGRHEESLALALACGSAFEAGGLPVERGQADLAAARAALALGRDAEAEDRAQRALRAGEADDLPSLLYPARHLLASVAERQGDPAAALRHAEQAMDQLERLRRQLMIEHRAEFLEDKAAVYEDAAHLALQQGRADVALAIAERARSRVLVELLDYRLNIGIRARTRADEPLVAELARLREERDALYRRWQGPRDDPLRGWTSPAGDQRDAQAQVLAIEGRITGLWRQLLVRNADYIHDAEFWERPRPFALPALPEGTVLIEYFRARGRLYAFAATAAGVSAAALPVSEGELERLLRLLQLNVHTVAAQAGTAALRLEGAAIQVGRALHAALLAPVAALPGRPLDRARELIIVPSGPLHYLPFHALHDGERYVAERTRVGYLSSAALLGRPARAPRGAGDAFVLGISAGGALPHAVREARAVARLLGAEPLLEADATVAALRARGGAASLLHLATHAEFRPDNPLFSGLALADQWLTTLDIFGLELAASLVTLSGCHTGRNVVGGGEELLGLARAFLAAGASSLLLSLWAVEDESTAEFMGHFYGALTCGATKAEALRQAQAAFIADARRRHPYFWGAFALVGEMK